MVHAYYSVVETCTHWFIVYGFFHPRDWNDSSMDQEHENDLEGLLTIARKDGSRFGRLDEMVTVYHDDFYSFTPFGNPLGNGRETIDGQLMLQSYEGSLRPQTVQQTKGHGLKAFPYTSNFHGKSIEDGILYYLARAAGQVPKNGNDCHVNYNLIDLFSAGGLWKGHLFEAKMSTSASKRYHKWELLKAKKEAVAEME